MSDLSNSKESPNHPQPSLVNCLHQSQVCLHPTDTIPGLTFSYASDNGLKNLLQVKKRPIEKGLVHLATDINKAFKLFSPLPEGWKNTLQKIWPGPLTVIWKAADSFAYPQALVEGMLAIRVPQLANDDMWYHEVLKSCGGFLPSTSVNKSGEPSLTKPDEITKFCQQNHIKIPHEITLKDLPPSSSPSLIIRITGKNSYEILRDSQPQIKAALNHS